MKKIPLHTILLKFYNRDIMRYVGTQWKSSGFLLLLALCFYASLFVGTSLANSTKEAYEITYRPALKELPAILIEDNKFKLDQEEPLKIFHPVTKEAVFYVDTKSAELKKEAADFTWVISQDNIIFQAIPMPIEPKHISSYIAVNSLTEFSGAATTKAFDKSLNLFTPMFIACYTITSFLTESLKILMIAVLVLFIFSKRQQKQKFKDITRLAILCYIPVIVINSIYQMQSALPGTIATIVVTFIHITLLMKAISINDLSQEQYDNLENLH